jgi:hypothetical protein
MCRNVGMTTGMLAACLGNFHFTSSVLASGSAASNCNADDARKAEMVDKKSKAHRAAAAD